MLEQWNIHKQLEEDLGGRELRREKLAISLSLSLI